MTRTLNLLAQLINAFAQTVMEPAADHFAWSNTLQVLLHAVFGFAALAVSLVAHDYNPDGTKPPLANVSTMVVTKTELAPRKEDRGE